MEEERVNLSFNGSTGRRLLIATAHPNVSLLGPEGDFYHSAHCPLGRPSLKLIVMASHPLETKYIFIPQGCSAFGNFIM